MQLSARLLLGVLLALISQVLARGAPVGQKTHLLDEHNFEPTTRSGTWIVKHYSPTCGHCLNFQPKWDAVVAARSVELFERDVHFGEIDCSANMQLCLLNKVESWPRVVVFSDSKAVDSLNGDRSEQELREFIDKALAPVSATPPVQERKYVDNSVILDATNFTQTTEQGIWLVKLYSPTCPHCRAMAPDWTKMTDELADQMASVGVTFGEVDCPANKKVCEANHVDGYPTINLFVNGVYIEEMYARYKYQGMKDYTLELIKRIGAKEFDKPPQPVVNNDNRDWDDADDTVSAAVTEPVKEKTAIKEKEKSEPVAAAEEEPLPNYNPDGEVVALTVQNFAERTASGPWFIKFYAPWCGHCQHLAPTWIKLGEAAKGKVNVGEINCDQDADLCKKYNVQGYPSLKLLWEGESVEFKSSRDLDTMIGFVDHVLSKPNNIHSIADLRMEQSKNDVVYVLAYSATDTGAKTKAALSHVKANAQKMFQSRNLNLVTDLAVAREALGSHIKDLSTPVLAALKDSRIVAYEGSLVSDDQLHEWFYAERFPLLPELSRENSDDLFYDSEYLVLAILDTERGAEHVTAYRDIARDAAIEYTRTQTTQSSERPAKSSVRFAWVDGIKWAAYVDRVFGLKRASWPAI
ncbi:hypothetical protein GGI05_004746, partial [Coemansia sp. RSA 2603]